MELNYKEYGQGYPIIILHGLFGTLDNWQTLAKQLSEEYSVYCLDLRNHGRSPHDAAINYPLMAADVRYFMETNWIYEAIVIGHSMGGKVAMQLATQHPDIVSKLIVIDIAPKVYAGGHEKVFNALYSIDLKKLQDRKEAENQLMQQLDNDTGTVQFLLKNLSRTKDGFYEWKMNLDAIRQHYPSILANIEGAEIYDNPTLFIKGEQSNYILDTDFEGIKKIFPKATFETIANAGHWVHADQPTALLHTITAFL